MMNNTQDPTSRAALYPAQIQQRREPTDRQDTSSSDELVARELQAQYDREAHQLPVAAQPAFQQLELPFNCGNCGMAHLVRNAQHNSLFQCTRCGRQNRIAIQNDRPRVIVCVSTV